MEGATTIPINSTPKKSDEPRSQSLIGANWPSLPIPADTQSQDSPIPPAQKSPTAWKGQQRGPDDYEKDRVGRYAEYFKGNEILPIPEIAEKITPRVLSLVVSDLKTKRFVGLNKDSFEELLRKSGIPCQYFCRKSFATWDVLLPTEQQAAKTAEKDIITKHFRLQPEYQGTRRLRVTVCNVPAIITGEVLAAYLSAFGQVEEFNLLRSPAGTAYGVYAFRLCLTRDGFKAIPETLICGDRQMIVLVEGRRPRCWGCKQIGHIAKFCPQRPENREKATLTTTTTTTTGDAAATTTTINKETEAKGPGPAQPKSSNQEGWTEVARKRKGSPKQGEKSSSPPQKKAQAAVAVVAAKVSPEPPVTPASATPATPAPETSAPAASPRPSTTTTPKTPTVPLTSPKKHKKKNKINAPEEMETNVNLKRRRDSGEGTAKKICPEQSKAGPSSQPQEKPTPPPLPPPPFHLPQILQTTQPPRQIVTLLPQQEHCLKKYHRPYQIPLPRSQSADWSQPLNLTRTHSLPSLSPSSIVSQELFPARQKQDPPASKKKKTPNRQEGKNQLTIKQIQQAAALCSVELEAVGDFQLRKALKPLLSLEKIQNLNVSNPVNFRSAAMVTTFVRSAGDRTKGVWKFLSTVCQTDTGIKLAELEHSSLKKCIPFCSGRVPILVHPSLYRYLKLRFPIDVGGITWDNRVTTELGTGSLRQAVGILTPKDFRPVVDTE